MAIELRGERSTGEDFIATVQRPQLISTHVLMKLSAFADRKDDENKDLGRHHALDA